MATKVAAKKHHRKKLNGTHATKIDRARAEFAAAVKPLEVEDGDLGNLHVTIDKVTGAHFCECHIAGDTLVKLGTVDVPIDPELQGDYRANREIRWEHPSFGTMVKDAKKGRPFSNIVAEYTTDFDPSHPIKIIGGDSATIAL